MTDPLEGSRAPGAWLRSRLDPDLPERLAGFLGRPVPEVREDLRAVRAAWLPLLAEQPDLVATGQVESESTVLAGRRAGELMAAGLKLAEATGGGPLRGGGDHSRRREAVARLYVPLLCTELARWREQHELDPSAFRQGLATLSQPAAPLPAIGMVDRGTVRDLVARHAGEAGAGARQAPRPPGRARELAPAAAVVLIVFAGAVGIRAAFGTEARAGSAEMASPARGLDAEERAAILALDAAIADVRTRFDTITDMGSAQSALPALEQAARSLETVAERGAGYASAPFRAAIRSRARDFLPWYGEMVAGAVQIEGVGAVLHGATRRIENALRRLASGGAAPLDWTFSPHDAGRPSA